MMYYCPACKRVHYRDGRTKLVKGKLTMRSFCMKMGRAVVLRRTWKEVKG